MKAIRRLFLLLALGEAAFSGIFHLAAQVVPSASEPVVVPVRLLLSVKTKGGFSTDLAQTEIQIKDNGTVVPIEEVKKLADARMRYCILFDTSNSEKQDFQLLQRAALNVLQQAVQPDTDSGWLVLFDTKPNQGEETTDRMMIGKAIVSARPGGGTAFYDAIIQCAQRMTTSPAGLTRRVMFIFSDGDDNLSQATSKAAMRAALQAGVRTYVVYPTTFVKRESRFFLQHLTEESGGTLFEVNGQKDADVFPIGLNHELRNLMTVTYASNPPKENEFHHIEIKCERKGVRISAPKSIYLHN